MTRLSEKQMRELREQTSFWVQHVLHWYAIVGCLIVTALILYTFWGNDSVFAASMLGG